MWVSSEHILEKCLVGVLDTPKSSKKASQSLSVGGLSAATSGPSVRTAGELSLTVPAVSTPRLTQSEEEALSLDMLQQARIQSRESVEEEVSVPVPGWIKPPEQTVSESVNSRTSEDELEGSSVDPPHTSYTGYETAV